MMDDLLAGMVVVPAGSFAMGIAEEDLDELVRMGRGVPHIQRWAEQWFGHEMPRRTVRVESFAIDTHEVTNEQFGAFVHESGYRSRGHWKRHADRSRRHHPVVNVTWTDATEYARWRGKRLPTEEEWEYAARGGRDVRWFPWGDTPDRSKANYRDQGESFLAGVGRILRLRPIGTRPVGSYQPNGYGLFDMSGNVSEWVDSVYQPYPGGPTPAPAPKADGKRVSRGGDWTSPSAVFVRLTARRGAPPDWFDWTVGFRCARDVAPDRSQE